jgi:hypothetical protein
MNAAGEIPTLAPWMAGWRKRIAAVLAFAVGVWVALATDWGLTLGWHFALHVSAATWESILGFGTGLGLIFAISAPRPLAPARPLAGSALVSGALLVAGAWLLGILIHLHYPDLEGPMDVPWLSALMLAYWLGVPWLLARLTARVGRPAITADAAATPRA